MVSTPARRQTVEMDRALVCVCSPLDIDDEFKENLQELAPMFLASENLVVKEINGTPVTGRGLVECFKV